MPPGADGRRPEGGEDRESACAQAGKESAGENASDPAKPGENTAETQSGSGQEEKDGVSQNDMAGNGISENGVSGKRDIRKYNAGRRNAGKRIVGR